MGGIRIAIDGYSSTGKSTMARELAGLLNYRYIDTGAMYRALTLWCQKGAFIEEDGTMHREEVLKALPGLRLDFKYSNAHGRPVIHLNGENVEDEIRKAAVAGQVSKVAQMAELRRFLVEQQQAIAKAGAVVMDGRDIASVVMPDAELKIFMTASAEVRAQRRFDELSTKGQAMTLEEVRANLEERDFLDSTREESPLIQTEDALVLDNSNLSREAQLELALQWAKERGA